MPKSIFRSRTFWFNVVAGVVHFSGVLSPEYAVPIAAAGNILLRLLTDQAVTILP